MGKKLNLYVSKEYKTISSEIIKLLDLMDTQCSVNNDNIPYNRISTTYKKEHHMIIYPSNKLLELDSEKLLPKTYFIYIVETYELPNEILSTLINNSIHTFYVNKHEQLTLFKNVSYLPIPISEMNDVFEYDILYHGTSSTRIQTVLNSLSGLFNIHDTNESISEDDFSLNKILEKSQILLLISDDSQLISEYALCLATKYNIHIIMERNPIYLQNVDFMDNYRNNIHFINEITESNIDTIKRYLFNFIIRKNNISNFKFLHELSAKFGQNIDFMNIYEFAKYYAYTDIYKCINDVKHDKKTFHRFNCYNTIPSIKNIRLEPFAINSSLESVFVEFRSFPHAEFLLRNAIFKLGPEWSHTIVCGNNNYIMMEKIANNICSNMLCKINLIRLNVNYVTRKQYCHLLMSQAFWESFHGEKILIYQEDSCIFRKNIQDFLEYDYIGAPWPKGQLDNQIGVGNGGFSLRSKEKMLQVIQTVDPTACVLTENTIQYIKRTRLNCIPEDIYFTNSMIEHNIGMIAPWEIARNFSQETVESENPFGGHCFWNSNNKQYIFSLFTTNTTNTKHPRIRTIIKNLFSSKIMSDAISTRKVLFIEDLYRYFCENNNAVISQNWAGIYLHFEQFDTTFQKLLHTANFVRSLTTCQSIFVYHSYIKIKLEEVFHTYRINIPIYVVYLPYIRQLEDATYSISILPTTTLYYMGSEQQQILEKFNRIDTIYAKSIFSHTNYVNTIDISVFISLFKKNIICIFIEPYTHTDKIVWLMEHNIPFFINKIESSIEYLGIDYPLYYENMEDMSERLRDTESLQVDLQKGYEYIRAIDTSNYSFESFHSIMLSSIN